MKRLLYALRFLTILPLPYHQGEDMKAVGRSVAVFPLAGLFIGAVLAGLSLAFRQVFSPGTSGILILVFWVILTGGLHLDGLSDLADGLGGGRTREDKLAIMKDSRVGAFGVLALVCVLLLKGRLLSDLVLIPAPGMVRVLLFVPTAARGILAGVIFAFPNARPGGMGSFFKENARKREAAAALLLAAAAAWLALGLAGIFLAAGAFLLCLAAGAVISRILGGLTGDGYGALCEGAELLLLLGAVGWGK